MSIVENVREGLTSKIEGLRSALSYVRDPREVKRLTDDLNGAIAALEKLNAKDTRTPEELEELSSLIHDEVNVESAVNPWDTMSPIEKFAYHVRLYSDKLDETLKSVEEQNTTLGLVVCHLKKTKGDSAPFMNPIIKQFENSLAEVRFSGRRIEDQIAIREAALKLVEDEDFFAKLDLLNRFLNNPMSLPHLQEEYKAGLEALRSNEE